MRNFPQMLFLVPDGIISVLAICFGEKRERKAALVILAVLGYVGFGILLRRMLNTAN
jgi:hypothetical protein